jgi:hypothetical protein
MGPVGVLVLTFLIRQLRLFILNSRKPKEEPAAQPPVPLVEHAQRVLKNGVTLSLDTGVTELVIVTPAEHIQISFELVKRDVQTEVEPVPAPETEPEKPAQAEN